MSPAPFMLTRGAFGGNDRPVCHYLTTLRTDYMASVVPTTSPGVPDRMPKLLGTERSYIGLTAIEGR